MFYPRRTVWQQRRCGLLSFGRRSKGNRTRRLYSARTHYTAAERVGGGRFAKDCTTPQLDPMFSKLLYSAWTRQNVSKICWHYCQIGDKNFKFLTTIIILVAVTTKPFRKKFISLRKILPFSLHLSVSMFCVFGKTISNTYIIQLLKHHLNDIFDL